MKISDLRRNLTTILSAESRRTITMQIKNLWSAVRMSPNDMNENENSMDHSINLLLDEYLKKMEKLQLHLNMTYYDLSEDLLPNIRKELETLQQSEIASFLEKQSIWTTSLSQSTGSFEDAGVTKSGVIHVAFI